MKRQGEKEGYIRLLSSKKDYPYKFTIYLLINSRAFLPEAKKKIVKDLADKLGISVRRFQYYIYAFRDSKLELKDKAKIIAKYFGVTEQELLTDPEKDPDQEGN